jgi:hypothetical protein
MSNEDNVKRDVLRAVSRRKFFGASLAAIPVLSPAAGLTWEQAAGIASPSRINAYRVLGRTGY